VRSSALTWPTILRIAFTIRDLLNPPEPPSFRLARRFEVGCGRGSARPTISTLSSGRRLDRGSAKEAPVNERSTSLMTPGTTGCRNRCGAAARSLRTRSPIIKKLDQIHCPAHARNRGFLRKTLVQPRPPLRQHHPSQLVSNPDASKSTSLFRTGKLR